MRGFADLQTFVRQLERDGDLAVVEAPVSARLEVAEIHRRVIAAGGPALMFRNVVNADLPLVTNLFGTARRVEAAFGARPGRWIQRLVRLVGSEMPPTIGSLWSARGLVREGLRVGTRRRRRGPVTEIVQTEPRLDRLPAITSWPEDGGPFITLPVVFTEHPQSGGHNLGMYRMQIFDEKHTGMHWQIGKGGGFHFAEAEASGLDLPVSVFLGGPPALILAAVAPLPENVPELLLGSMLAGHRLELCPGRGPHSLLARAEIALSGTVRAGERRAEGPFGDHYGYYSLQHDYPVFHVQAMHRRRDAIFPATVVGKPRQEDFFIGDFLQELLAPLFPLVMPAVQDLWSYGETGYHALAAAVVKQRYAREAMASAFRILGEGQLSLTKFLIATDRPVDLRDFPALLQHLLERTRPERDLYVFSNLSMDTLDYAGPEVNRGSKGVWLGLGDPVRELPRGFSAAEMPTGVAEVRVFCPGCVVVEAPSYGDEPSFGRRIAEHPAFAPWPLVVLSDDAERATASTVNFLWSTFTRFEPAGDISAANVEVCRHHLAYTAPVVIDARMKPWYPKELFCDHHTAATVDRRWHEYFPDRDVEMGDSDRGHLS